MTARRLFKMSLDNNRYRTVRDAKRFAHVLAGSRFWFAYHRNAWEWCLSHFDSGLKIATISPAFVDRYRANLEQAARLTLEGVISKHGAAKMARLLKRAPPAGRATPRKGRSAEEAGPQDAGQIA